MRKWQVFISYRREGGSELARLAWDVLKRRGYAVFMDVEDLRSGPFNTALYDKIQEASDMVLILTPNSLDRCQQGNDWLRLEVEYALKHKKNVVPVMTRGFRWPAPDFLPSELGILPTLNGVSHSPDLFDASIDKLEKMLIAKPRPIIKKRLVPFVVLIIAVIICVILVALLNKPWAHAPISSRNVITEAKECFDRKDYASAFHTYSQASDVNLQDIAIHRQIEECARLGHLEKQFLERYAALVVQYPQHAVLHNYLGNAYLMVDPQDKDGKAKQQYETALNLEPKLSSPLANLGIIAYRAGKPDQAESLFKRYLVVEPGDAQGWINLSLIYIDRIQKNADDKDNSKEGENAICRAIEIEPGSASAYKALGRLFAATNRKKEALNAFQRSLALNFEQSDVRQQVELLAWEAGGARFPGLSADDFKTRGLNLDNADKPAAIVVMQLLDEGKYKETETACQEWIKLESDNWFAYYLLGFTYGKQGQVSEAESSLDEADRLFKITEN